QRPGEPRHRPSHQADAASARPRAPGRARLVHGGADRRRAAARSRVTAREAIAEAERRLAAAGVDTPRVDADILVSHVLGVSRTQLYADLDREVDGIEPLILRRERREPIAYVVGAWGFPRPTLKSNAREPVPRTRT